MIWCNVQGDDHHTGQETPQRVCPVCLVESLPVKWFVSVFGKSLKLECVSWHCVGGGCLLKKNLKWGTMTTFPSSSRSSPIALHILVKTVAPGSCIFDIIFKPVRFFHLWGQTQWWRQRRPAQEWEWCSPTRTPPHTPSPKDAAHIKQLLETDLRFFKKFTHPDYTNLTH